MEYGSLYLVAEELISSIQQSAEQGRKLAGLIYNSACYILDRSITAWYKTLAVQDRLAYSEKTEAVGLLTKDREKEAWVQKLKALLKIPWILPIYEYKAGIALDVSRRVLQSELSNYILKDVEIDYEGEFAYYLLRRGIPPPDVKLVGLAVHMRNIGFDDDKFDYVGNTLKRDAYSDARTSILEMGAPSARNIPHAGFVRASEKSLCPHGPQSLYSPWTFFTQGAMQRRTPLSNWTGYLLVWEYMSHQHALKYIRLCAWKTEVEAALQIEALHYQLFNYPSWSYLLGQVALEIATLQVSVPRVVHSMNLPERLFVRKGFDPSEYQHSYMVGTTLSIVRSIVKRGRTVERIKKLFSNKKLLEKWAAAVGKTQVSIPYDPSRLRFLTGLITRLRLVDDLDARKDLLERFRKATVLRDHFYFDKASGTRICCEHVAEEARLLSIGAPDMDELKARFASDSSSSVIGMDFVDPRIVECQYCGADLGSVWYVSRETEESFQARAGESFLDDDIGSAVVKLLASHSVITDLGPLDVTRVVKMLIEGPLNRELGKLSRSNPTERVQKEVFVTLSAIVSALRVVSLAGAPLEVSKTNLERHISKDYIDVFKVIGVLPSEAIERMFRYWGTALSKYYSDSELLVRNVVDELLGDKADERVLRYYDAVLLYPLKVYGYTKVKSDAKTKAEGKGKATKTVAPPPVEEVDVASIKNSRARKYYDLLRSEVGSAPRVRPVPPGVDAIYVRREERLVANKKLEPTKHYASAEAMVKEEDAFRDAVFYICPELLLHPTKSPFEGVGMEEYRLGPHTFAPGKGCTRCGIDTSFTVSPTYFKKYSKLVMEKWVSAKPPVTVPCSEPEPPKVKRAAHKDDAEYDKKLIKRFSDAYGWQAIPDPSLSSELGHIMLDLGYVEIGEALITRFDEKKAKTAWNRFLEWVLGKEAPLVNKLLLRLRSRKAGAKLR